MSTSTYTACTAQSPLSAKPQTSFRTEGKAFQVPTRWRLQVRGCHNWGWYFRCSVAQCQGNDLFCKTQSDDSHAHILQEHKAFRCFVNINVSLIAYPTEKDESLALQHFLDEANSARLVGIFVSATFRQRWDPHNGRNNPPKNWWWLVIAIGTSKKN